MSTKKNDTLQYTFKNTIELKRAYMAFVSNGAIFIPTEQQHELGQTINVLITLAEQDKTFQFNGEIIWITPKSTPNTGIGITCDEAEGNALKKIITDLLAESKENNIESSHTM